MTLWLAIPITIIAAVNVGRLLWDKKPTEIMRAGFVLLAIGLACWILY